MSITAETLSKTLQLVTCFLQIALSLKGIHHQRQDTRTTWKALLIKPCYRYCVPSTIFLSSYLSQLLRIGCSLMGTKLQRTGSDQRRHHKVTRTCPSFGPQKDTIYVGKLTFQNTWSFNYFPSIRQTLSCAFKLLLVCTDRKKKREMLTIFSVVTIERKICVSASFKSTMVH